MRCFFVLLLLLLPGISAASENLIENMRSGSGNVTISDGIIYQIIADPRQDLQWKIQTWFNNTKHWLSSRISYEQLGNSPFNNSIGFISFIFTTPQDIDDLLYFRFGLNGIDRDTTVEFDIKDVMPNTTYTIQWRVLNNVQGEIAWTDMRVVQCGDGYSLALGDENCSRECENQSNDGGYVPPNESKVYEPDLCTYDVARLVCNDGYTKIDNVCEQMCMTGARHLHVGDTVNGLYVRKLSSPALHIEYNGNVCYGHLSPGNGLGLNIDFNGAVYHLID